MEHEFKQARTDYQNIPIPPELDARVRAGIRQGQEARRQIRRRRWYRRGLTVAACLALLVGTLNLSPTVAAAAANVPVLGPLFQILTLRNDVDIDRNRVLTVRQPAVEGDGPFIEIINAEIQKRVDEKVSEGEQMVREYREAFLETGGTQAEWEAHDISVTVDYEVKSRTDSMVSFLVEAGDSYSHSYWERDYYNLDLASQRELTLADLLGDDWVSLCDEAVRSQMTALDGCWPEAFTTVTDSNLAVQFYVNEASVPVLVFPPYAIAPGVMGYVEFEVTQ